ncbi:MAG: glycoside hydrolase family 32 protein, partial [Sedimentisphaerales bacterium]|nr:glycoside hydrolase family 32 protein [Sedimentisphaerales bacterium]
KFTQSLAYSNDKGRSFTKYHNNPVIKHISGNNRDPKVFWYAPDGNWVMALYLDKNEMAIFTSKDLKTWTPQSRLRDSFHECPELFELSVDGDENNKKWVFYGASGDYYIGSFDGKEFTPQTPKLKFQHGDCFYASQTFNNMPDDRRVQIAWGQVEPKNMPFNQMMLFPVELSLRKTDDNIRLFAQPIKEIKNLYGKKRTVKNKTIKAGSNPLDGLEGDCFDITAEIKIENSSFGFNIRGLYITYDVAANELICGDVKAKVKPIAGKLKLRLLVDRTSVEIFANDGQIYIPLKALPKDDSYKTIEFFAADKVTIVLLEAYRLRSVWQ